MKHLLFLLLSLSLMACATDEPMPSPQQRSQATLQALRDTLLSAQHG